MRPKALIFQSPRELEQIGLIEREKCDSEWCVLGTASSALCVAMTRASWLSDCPARLCREIDQLGLGIKSPNTNCPFTIVAQRTLSH